MKFKNTLFALVILSSLFIFCGATCKNATTTAIKAEGVTVATVDTGMKTWAIYANSGQATKDQVDAVQNAYNTYYNAQVIAEAALEKVVSGSSTNSADVTTANAAVLTAQSSLLLILSQYMTPAVKPATLNSTNH